MEDNNNVFHRPVLVDEVIRYLEVKPGKKYIDATVGGAGHTKEIIRNGGEVLGIDRDPKAITFARQRLTTELPAGLAGSWILVRGNFKNIAQIAEKHDFTQVSGILMDIGLSSFHLDASGRGFSFRKNEPLDMRMNPEAGITAFEVINTYSEEKLYEIFLRYGEEQLAQQLARHLTSTRRIKPIATTKQLFQLFEELAQKNGVSSREVVVTAFQAIRIEVNGELDNLKQGLEQALSLLAVGGRLAVISFHSLEDRIVKLFYKNSPELKIITNKPVRPSDREVDQNRRARSALLRVAERVPNKTNAKH